MSAPAAVGVLRDAPISTWFGIGGRADALIAPAATDELIAALREHDPASGPVRVLGDGANLLVADDGADGLVVTLARLGDVHWTENGLVAGAGANLPKLVVEAARRGLAGFEGLGGIPASLGGAVRMNAGGAFGEIGRSVRRVRVTDHAGREHTLTAAELEFGYRRSNLDGLIIIEVELALLPDDPAAVRSRLKEVMAHKKHAQPMADRSAGCVFQNPLVRGERVSAGRLIDKAGLKGARVGGASVSERHANFIVVDDAATAADVLELIGHVQSRVLEHQGIELVRELVVWSRHD